MSSPKIKKTAELSLLADGKRLFDEGLYGKAELAWRGAIDADPNSADALIELANLLAKTERKAEARALLDEGFRRAGRSAASLLQWANGYACIQEWAVALELYESALALDPSAEIPVLLARGKIYGSQDKWDAAVELLDKILARDPNHFDALNCKMVCLHLLAKSEEEVAALRRLIALRPDAQLHSRLLFDMLYVAGTTPELVYEESQRWFSLYGSPLAKNCPPHRNKPDPNRRIKIAYVSPDLRKHAIMKLLPAVFELHDATQFDVSFYSISEQKDVVSEQISRAVSRIVSLPPLRETIAAQTRADEIDILVDLAGHTMRASAHLVFAMKPAPVQVSWLGAVSTTGMPTIDYYIGDAHSPCPGTEQFFAESVYRLPRVPCAYRPAADLSVAESPFFRNGFITFGIFNDPRKIGRDLIKLWAAILHVVPGSKLFFKFCNLEKSYCQDRLRQGLLEDGISAERFRFEAASAPLDYLRAWDQVDIALDPYPYNGGTTTMDALWMGVPVVTLAGRLAVSRCGASLLSSLGLPVAYTTEEYIQTALFLVENIPKTPGIRRGVRQAMLNSALLDEKGLVRTLEAAYRDMWVKWCRSRNGIEN